jgi:hypothetical protein
MKVYFQLKDLEKKGIELSKRFTLTSNIDEMEDELRLHMEREQRKNGIELGKMGLLKAALVLEKLNGWFDPLGIRLNGWHQQMTTNIDNYDSVLGELSDKYSHHFVKVEPEIKLLWMIGSSALSFHYTQKYVEEHGLDSVMNKNPGLFQSIQSKIASALENTVGKEQKEPEQKPLGLNNTQLYNTVHGLNSTVQPMQPPPPTRGNKINEILNNVNASNVLNLSDTITNVQVNTVDSDSVSDINTNTSSKKYKRRVLP